MNGHRAKITAEAGLIDYVFLSNLNRLNHHTLPVGDLRKDLYGDLVIEIDPMILLKRDFFVYPFNIGYDWKNRHSNQKLSDLSTLQKMINSWTAGAKLECNSLKKI